ncbi:MAG TPA: hypothetical protein VM031_02430, partial [Phycisphaerae bacterium]|nr:hypothetical protein [Phycisphaerae bacterium]
RKEQAVVEKEQKANQLKVAERAEKRADDRLKELKGEMEKLEKDKEGDLGAVTDEQLADKRAEIDEARVDLQAASTGVDRILDGQGGGEAGDAATFEVTPIGRGGLPSLLGEKAPVRTSKPGADGTTAMFFPAEEAETTDLGQLPGFKQEPAEKTMIPTMQPWMVTAKGGKLALDVPGIVKFIKDELLAGKKMDDVQEEWKLLPEPSKQEIIGWRYAQGHKFKAGA